MLEFTFNECKNKMVMIKIIDSMDDYSSTEYMSVDSERDYQLLEDTIDNYDDKGILDEYFIYD